MTEGWAIAMLSGALVVMTAVLGGGVAAFNYKKKGA